MWVEQAGALTLDELSRSCGAQVEWLVELVQEGGLELVQEVGREPVQEVGREPAGDAPPNWRFAATSLRRARIAWRLRRDLQVNAAGAALALELLDEIDSLRRQLQLPLRPGDPR
jgi:chaperone modulatory protein CbpM